MSPPRNIQPTELRQRLEDGTCLRVIDVREPHEWELCRIEGAELKPVSQIRNWEGELDPEGGPYVVYCHHGMRSAQVCHYLHQKGFHGLLNLAGGIDAWRRAVDPGMPAY